MERIFKNLQAWGFPQAGIDWLRRRRLLVIILLAAISWVAFAGLAVAIYLLASHLMMRFSGAA